MISRIISIFYYLLLTIGIQAQTPIVEKVLEDKLPGKTIWCTYQDKLGYLWIATNSGLCRYDGSELEVYTKEDGLWSNNVTWLSGNDNGDMIAVCVKKGVNLISIHHKPVFSIVGDRVNFNYDVFMIDDLLATHLWNYLPWEARIDYQYLSHDPKRLIRFNEEELLMTTNRGLLLYNIYTCSESFAFSVKEDPHFFSLHSSSNGELLIGSQGVVYVLDNFKLKEKFEDGLPDRFINFILSDKEGNIFCNVSHEGLYMKRKESKQFISLQGLANLKGVHMNHLLLDDDGNIWASSWGKGLFRISGAAIQNYVTGDDLPINSIQQLVFSEAIDELFISGHDDIYSFNNSTCLPLNMPANDNDEVNINTIESIQEDLLVRYNLGSPYQRFETEKGSANVYRLPAIKFATKFKDPSSIWFSDVLLADMRFTKVVKQDTSWIKVDSLREHRLIQEYPHEQFNIVNRELWQATGEGLVYKNYKTHEFYESRNDSINFFQGLFQNTIINKIYAYSDDEIWFATDNGLIGRMHDHWIIPEGSQFLKSQNVKDIAFENNGNLWFVTQKELAYYDHKKLHVFSSDHGFIQDEFSYVEFNNNNEEVIVGNANSFSTAGKQELMTAYNLEKDDFKITEIEVDGVPVSVHEKLELQPNQKELSISSSLIDFSVQGPTFYEYQLNQDSWVAFEQGRLVLRNLKSNNYTIQIRSSKDKLNWVYADEIHFEVLPYWYQTIWFLLFLIILTVLFATGITFLVIKRNKRLANQEIALNNRIAYLEQRALTASMNPHFIFNVLNSIQDFVQKKDHLKTSRYIAKFGNLIRLYLESSLQATITIQEEFYRAELYLELEKLRFENEFSYTISCDPELETDIFIIPSMVVQPYIENAIWHGIRPKGKGRVQVSCQILKERIQIEIIDDGIGFQESENNKNSDNNSLNLATKITKERIQLFGAEQGKGGSVQIDSNSMGTTVSINIPMISA